MATDTTLRRLDAEAAVRVDGWTEIRERAGDITGKPRVGLRRPVIGYSTDLRRATQLARKAVRMHGKVANDASVSVTLCADEVQVEAFNPSTGETLESSVERTDSLPEALTRAAVHLSLRAMKAK